MCNAVSRKEAAQLDDTALRGSIFDDKRANLSA